MKRKLILFSIALLATSAYAKEHVIERGETIESISSQYGVSVQEILKANPGMEDMFFSGMVINIPESSETMEKTDIKSVQPAYVTESAGSGGVMDKTKGKSIVTETAETYQPGNDEELTIGAFSNTYLTYMAHVKAFGKGSYGIGLRFELGNTKYLGMEFAMKMNYGLVDPGELGWDFGFVGGYPLCEYVMPFIRMMGNLDLNSPMKEVKTVHLHSGDKEYYSYGTSVGGGLFFTPGFSFKYKRVVLSVGYDLGFYSRRSADGTQYEIKQSSTMTTVTYPKTISSTDFDHKLVLTLGLKF